MLPIRTHGSGSPTHAILPFLNAQGAQEARPQAELPLIGDAVVLSWVEAAQSTVGFGWPAAAGVFASLIDRAVPLHV